MGEWVAGSNENKANSVSLYLGLGLSLTIRLQHMQNTSQISLQDWDTGQVSEQ